jgi:tRNA pseudouridine38-40 synthase
MLRFYKLTIAYDGTAFSGWQRQIDPVRTVQRVVEQTAGEILNHPVICRGASRTDQGVHAWGQVATLETEKDFDPQRLRLAINSQLPPDVMIRRIEEVDARFDVRAAVRKRYRYFIWTGRERPLFQRHYVYHYRAPFDLGRMREACRHFEGRRDFAALQGAGAPRLTTVRTVFRCTAEPRRGPLVSFVVEGDGFLYHMVRNMVGTALEAARGKIAPDDVAGILASCDRTRAGPCAPARGLCLQWIRYECEMRNAKC